MNVEFLSDLFAGDKTRICKLEVIAGELIFNWVASEVELAREQCPGAADRVGHQV